MALTGVHITFGSVSAGASVVLNAGLIDPYGPNFLPYSPTASQTMATAALSTVSASQQVAVPLLSISASAPIFYVTGPNATLAQVTDGVTPRRYMDPSFGREDVFVNKGDFFAWTFA